MDFSLPSDDNKSVFSVSPSATNSYFTEQALRAGFLGNDVRRADFAMNSDPLRDAIQRELEKERIREEIIAAEIMRRRELEMEVRRELAMERELALRRGDGFPVPGRFPMLNNLDGFGLEERIPLSGRTEVGSFDRLPFQRHCETAKVADVGKGQAGKVMFLAKPTSPSVTGTKRKITAVGAGELTVTGPKKKPHKEWSCALCQVSATSERGLNDHLQGRKHKAKEGGLRANRVADKQPGGSTSLEKKTDKPVKLDKKTDKSVKLVKNGGSPKQKHGKKLEAKVMLGKRKQKTQDLKQKKFKYWCEDCHVGCHSPAVMASHQKGRKHIARLQAQKQNGNSFSSATNLNDVKQGKEEADASGERNTGAVDNVDVAADGIEEAEDEGEVDGVEEAQEKGEEEASIELEPPSDKVITGTETTKEVEDDLTDDCKYKGESN